MNRINLGMLVTALLTTATLQACDNKASPTITKQEPTADSVDSRSKVIGVTPEPPKPEGMATTSPVPSTVTKQQQSNSMPLPGQANDHSNSAKDSSQKSRDVPKK